MNACFGDTFYFLALLNVDDAAHESVRKFLEGFDRSIVTTDWVLIEVADAMASLRARSQFCDFVDGIKRDGEVRIVRADSRLFDEGFQLYRQRPDKAWPLTDCISFAVMTQLGINDALTADRHFEQAGFT